MKFLTPSPLYVFLDPSPKIFVRANVRIGKWPGDHECRQIGSVDGEKDEGKRCPDVGHETGGRTPRAIHVDCSLESRVGKVFVMDGNKKNSFKKELKDFFMLLFLVPGDRQGFNALPVRT